MPVQSWKGRMGHSLRHPLVDDLCHERKSAQDLEIKHGTNAWDVLRTTHFLKSILLHRHNASWRSLSPFLALDSLPRSPPLPTSFLPCLCSQASQIVCHELRCRNSIVKRGMSCHSYNPFSLPACDRLLGEVQEKEKKLIVP